MLKQETFYEVQSWGCVSALLGLPAELNPQMFVLVSDDMGYYTSRRGACQRFFTKIYPLFSAALLAPPLLTQLRFSRGRRAAKCYRITYPICRTER